MPTILLVKERKLLPKYSVLVIGSGAREHAIVWAISRSRLLKNLYVSPGNAGTSQIATNIDLGDFNEILLFCRHNSIDFVVIGPEKPLAEGLVDQLEREGILCFGPTAKAAQIESSKIWSYEFMRRNSLPTPRSFPVSDISQLSDQLAKDFPVVKADGLASGKGVKLLVSPSEVQAVVEEMLSGSIGQAGKRVLLQELLSGREISAHAFCDGQTFKLMPFVRDYKRIGKGDTGENTGGVGAYSNPAWLSEAAASRLQLLVEASFQSLVSEGIEYKGVLYPGFMLTSEGEKIIEYNARFGDPETQVILPKLEKDLLEILIACSKGCLEKQLIGWNNCYSVCVVLCSAGYPDPRKMKLGVPIFGLDAVPDDVLVFHAGTTLADNGQIITSSGRVLSVVVREATLEKAVNKVYEAVSCISFEGIYFRDDIGTNA